MNENDLSRGQIAACLSYALPNRQNEEFDVLGRFRGAINDVYRVKVEGAEYAFRVRMREEFFAYEKHIIKDVISGRTLTGLAGSTDILLNEVALDSIVQDTLARGRGGPVVSPISPRIIAYDHTQTLIPHLWILQEWQLGKPLQQGDLDGYFQAGLSLATLHAVKFAKFKRAIDTTWIDGSEWVDKFGEEIREKAAYLGIDTHLFGRIRSPQSLRKFNLGHNDLQPFNIIVTDEKRAVFIDWDNLQIAPPEFDLVKMKYWTVVGKDGYFTHKSEEYDAFLSGYLETAGVNLDQELLRFCELAWLLRVASFEKRRETGGQNVSKPFPSVPYYLHAIENL